MNADMAVKDVVTCSDGCKLALEFSNMGDQRKTTQVMIFQASAFEDPLPNVIESSPVYSSIIPRIEHIIGSHGTKLLFLDHQMWVCSLDLESDKGECYQHFFIPNDWVGANWNLLLKVTPLGDVVFVKEDELAVISRGLEYGDLIDLQGNN